MLLTIENNQIRLTVETLGAQMMSIQSQDGLEYLWQGDSRYWPDRAPTLFPFIGRLTNNSYCFEGRLYHMGIHGFAAASEFVPIVQEKDRVILVLGASPDTRRQYPFAFSLQVTYALRGNGVSVTYEIKNYDQKVMPFGIGGHPGFRVPLEDDAVFEDYILEFTDSACPDRVEFTPQVYLSGRDSPYPLDEGRILPLRHSLFDEDAIILKNMAREITLRSRKSCRGVTVSYPDMPYLGIWHWPKTDAPYVCIEPWSSLPSRQDVVEELSCKSDLIHLSPGKTFETTWTISVF